MSASISAGSAKIAKAPSDNLVWPIYNIAACLEFVAALEKTPFSRADIPTTEVSTADPEGKSRWYFMRRSLMAYKLAVEVGEDTYALTELAQSIKTAPKPWPAHVRGAAKKAARSPAIFAELSRAFPGGAPRDRVQEALEGAGYNETLARWAALNWEKSRDYAAGKDVRVIRRNRPEPRPELSEAEIAECADRDPSPFVPAADAASAEPFGFANCASGRQVSGTFNIRTEKDAVAFMESFKHIVALMGLPDGRP